MSGYKPPGFQTHQVLLLDSTPFKW
jgi:hypothetical protein